MTRGGIASRPVDFFENNCSLSYAEAGAAVLFGNERGKVSRLCQRLDELCGICASGVEFAPVGIGISFTEIAHALAKSFVKLHGGDILAAIRCQAELSDGDRIR